MIWAIGHEYLRVSIRRKFKCTFNTHHSLLEVHVPSTILYTILIYRIMAAYQQLAKSTSSSTSCTIHNLILKNIGKFIILNLLPKYVHTKKKLLCDLSYIQHPLSCKLKGSQQVRVWHLLGICWVRFSAQKIDLSLSTSLSEKSILPLLVCCYYSANGNYLQSRAILVSSMIIWASFYWLGILFHGPKISREFCYNKNSFSKFTDIRDIVKYMV